jgi:hypothetical protein
MEGNAAGFYNHGIPAVWMTRRIRGSPSGPASPFAPASCLRSPVIPAGMTSNYAAFALPASCLNTYGRMPP